MSETSGETVPMLPVRLSYRALYLFLFACALCIIFLLLPGRRLSCCPNETSGQTSGRAPVFHMSDNDLSQNSFMYNGTYPLTAPQTAAGLEYRVGLVEDPDESSRKGESFKWSSNLKTGGLVVHRDGSIGFKIENTIELTSYLSEKGRGAELSELIVFNGRLYTVDDRSGIIFEVRGGQLVPWVILEDGPGTVGKGFKAEWMAVKGHMLYVGGLGKVWTTQTGEYVNDHPQWVKVVSPEGVVHHQPWSRVYNDMKLSAGIGTQGYIIHESAAWSPANRKWYFLPRRASNERYNDVADEHRATNLMITADENLSNMETTHIGPLNNVHGFSSFKFLPGSRDSVIVALKSEENRGTIATYITAFDLSGKTLMAEQKIADVKLEGIEFI
ncbi:Soluble calcium-activated nucleotidase 1 [Geodia barretti]|uniref:Soluble calcium-activated nucleotidase 1 n=1 Tax=Geodia barretti TaxID=519541 RepID=A0AA35R012_GEOBA|nr:Soluble calcium-activated nucleotidase 1 [Geodia barretti]